MNRPEYREADPGAHLVLHRRVYPSLTPDWKQAPDDETPEQVIERLQGQMLVGKAFSVEVIEVQVTRRVVLRTTIEVADSQGGDG